MPPITTSLFEFFKIGPGPSSSHTIGPMQAAGHFRKLLEELPPDVLKQADHIEVTLYGSLSATGQGHGTPAAVTAGLLGWQAAEIDCEKLEELHTDKGLHIDADVAGKKLRLGTELIKFGEIEHDFPFNNTLDFSLCGGNKTLLTKRYYSVGGGFIQWDGGGPENPGQPAYPYSTMAELQEMMRAKRITLPELMRQNEQAITGMSEKQVEAKLDEILDVMMDSVDRGLNSEGVLPGPIKMRRKASTLWRQSKSRKGPGQFLAQLCSFALATSEENAAGHIVVTAPTLGAAGVVPAMLYWMKTGLKLPRFELRDALLAAAAVGFLIKHNASISGAEVGCQGEIGTASAMAAAAISQGNNAHIEVLANAAEIALEHHLGLTCDPVMGYVQIPCIERNAMGASKAYTAWLLASGGDPHRQKVSFDRAVDVMLQTGRDMCSRYKETSQAGLAKNVSTC